MPTFHYVQNQGKLMQSPENDQKPQFGKIFDDFEVKYLQAKNQKNRYSRFWEKYQSVWFWANLETFSRISQNQEFFQNTGSVTFLPL